MLLQLLMYVKGTLPDGKIVAVKVLSLESKQGEREFMSEISSISNISHENLVKLHGGCVERGFRILVYDYMDNNSLAQTLLGNKYNFLMAPTFLEKRKKDIYIFNVNLTLLWLNNVISSFENQAEKEKELNLAGEHGEKLPWESLEGWHSFTRMLNLTLCIVISRVVIYFLIGILFPKFLISVSQNYFPRTPLTLALE